MRLHLPQNPPDISARAVRSVWVAVGVLAILVLVSSVVVLVWMSRQNDHLTAKIEASDAELAELGKQVDDEHAAAQALEEQVKRLGGKPVVEPGEAKQGPPGPAPTEAQVLAAVADYCTDDRCKPIVSRAQVSEAVAAYCADGRCRGKDGVAVDGKNGTDGADGAPGPGPTAEQIDQAVADYCADSRCVGKPGADGTDGKDGTSITEVTCDRGTGTFTFTFSDGSKRTVECSPTED